MHTETLEKPRIITQADYMNIARWMVNYINRFASGNYDEIATLLHRSQSRAGGPALRLAQALWNFHYRVMYPQDHKWEIEEENTFAHLANRHMKESKSHYRVFRAMEIFKDMRLRTFPDFLLPTIEQEPVSTPHPLRRALRHFDETVLGAEKRVRQQHQLKAVMVELGNANPSDEAIFMATIAAAHAFAYWRIDTTSSEHFAAFQKATNHALELRHRNATYLGHHNPRLGSAIGILGKALSQ